MGEGRASHGPQALAAFFNPPGAQDSISELERGALAACSRTCDAFSSLTCQPVQGYFHRMTLASFFYPFPSGRG